jgi:sulfonate transport system permease protein
MSDALILQDRTPARATGRAPRRARRLAPGGWTGWILPIAILVLWQAGASTGIISSTVLPNPLDIGRAAYRLTASGELIGNMETSTLRALAGLLVGGGIGLAFGFANGLSRWSNAFSDTTLQMVRNVPHLALIPLVILWFGIDEGAKLFLVALGVFFPIYLNTLHGIRGVDPQLIEMGRSYGMGPGALFRRIVLPGALPSIFVGLRYALGITWLTLIVAETIAANSGIGYMAMQAREFMQTDIVVLAILIYAILGKLADSSVRLMERVFLSWNPVYRAGGAA